MDILLHTIALEPARWTPQRVSQPIVDLLPQIADKTPFKKLEIFEPHLTYAADENAVREVFAEHQLEPVILSSYFDLAKAAPDVFEHESAELLRRVRTFGFKKVRLFPGPGIPLDDKARIESFVERVRNLVSSAPDIEFLLETHDGSLADEPEVVVAALNSIACENVGLLFQPTFFEDEKTKRQFVIQRPFIRHLHLQNRAPNDVATFTRLADGVIRWREIIGALPLMSASIEFVPAGICKVDEFDLAQALDEAIGEAAFAQSCAH